MKITIGQNLKESSKSNCWNKKKIHRNGKNLVAILSITSLCGGLTNISLFVMFLGFLTVFTWGLTSTCFWGLHVAFLSYTHFALFCASVGAPMNVLCSAETYFKLFQYCSYILSFIWYLVPDICYLILYYTNTINQPINQSMGFY